MSMGEKASSLCGHRRARAGNTPLCVDAEERAKPVRSLCLRRMQVHRVFAENYNALQDGYKNGHRSR